MLLICYAHVKGLVQELFIEGHSVVLKVKVDWLVINDIIKSKQIWMLFTLVSVPLEVIGSELEFTFLGFITFHFLLLICLCIRTYHVTDVLGSGVIREHQIAMARYDDEGRLGNCLTV